jgi:hypothetical protein
MIGLTVLIWKMGEERMPMDESTSLMTPSVILEFGQVDTESTLDVI